MLQLLDSVHQDAWKAAGLHGLCLLPAPVIIVEHQVLVLESSLYSVVSTSGFSHAALNFDI